MTLAQMSLSGTAVIAAVALIRPFAVDALPRRILPLLWGLALARLLIPLPAPALLSLSARMAWVERVPSAVQAARNALADTGAESGKNPEEPAAFDSTPAPVEPAGEPAQPAHSIPAVPSPAFPFSAVWGIGTGTLCLSFALIWLRCRWRFRCSWPPEDPVIRDWLGHWMQVHPLRRPVSVRVCGEIQGPLTFGLLRPVILLPSSTNWKDRPALEFILYHEWIHVRRFDAAYKLALAAALCVHWCNPCVWLLYTLAGRDLELACDEAVIRRFGRESRLPYVNTLLDMESRKSGLAVPQFSARAAQERVAAVMKTRPSTLPARLISCVLALAVGLLAVSVSPPASARQRAEETTPEEAASEKAAPLRTIKVRQYSGYGSYAAAREYAMQGADRVADEIPIPGGVLLCVEQDVMRDFRGHGVRQSLALIGTDATVTLLPMMLDADLSLAGYYESILIENIQYNPPTRTVTWQVRTTALPDGETDPCSYVWEVGSSSLSVYAAWETWEERAVEIRSGLESAHYTEKSFQ